MITVLSKKLGFDDLRVKKRDRLHATARQAVMHYLKLNGFHEKKIAEITGRSRPDVIHNLKVFRDLLETKDKIATDFWDKLNNY